MTKIYDITLFFLEQIENKSSKNLLISQLVDAVAKPYPQGHGINEIVLSGAIYDINFIDAEISKKQIFGLCHNYYKNRCLVYLNIDNSLVDGWYQITAFSVGQISGPCYFPFNLSVVILDGQPALFWESYLIFNEYSSNYQYFISLSGGQTYTGGDYITVATATGDVSIKINSEQAGQFIPPLNINPNLADFYNGQCVALDHFRANDNNLYRTFQPNDKVEQINNGLIGVEWVDDSINILIWDGVWVQVAKFNLLITEIIRRSFALYLPYVISINDGSPGDPPTGPPSESGGGVISPVDDGFLVDVTKPQLMGVDINQVGIKFNAIINNDAFIKPFEARLTIKKGLPIVWIEFRTDSNYGIHHNSNLEMLGGLTIDSIENENESGLPTNGLASVSRWGKAILSNDMEVGFIWTRLKQDYLSNPAYPRPGDAIHLNLSRLTGDETISCLGIFALKAGHGYDTDQLSELFYGNSSTVHTMI